MASVYRYPYNIMDATTDYLLIECLEYKPGGIPSLTDSAGVFKKLKTAKALYNVVLPIPNGIASVNNVGWGESRLSGFAGLGLNVVGNAFDAAVESNEGGFLGALADAGAAAVDTTREQLLSASGGTKLRRLLRNAAVTGAVNSVVGSNIGVNDVFARNDGAIINQNLELLFNSVSLRPFSFTWDVTPRDEKESGVVKEIIYNLKKSQAAKRTTEFAFLSSPDVFRLSYRKGGEVHGYLNRFKICAMTSLGVNYTGSGAYATYGDQSGTPVHMKLNLAFTELEPIYADDYDKYPGGTGF